MGSGKTYLGKKWAAITGLKYFDIDDIVEEEQGKTISKIFEEDGEDKFRDLESIVLKSFAGKDNVIVATGGGTPCFKDNMKWMNENGISVYLKASPEIILNRLTSEKEKRPLIKHLDDNELLFYITQKIKERELCYLQANEIVNVDDLDEDFVPEFLR